MSVAARLLRSSLCSLGALPVGVRGPLGSWLGRAYGLLPSRESSLIKLQQRAFLTPSQRCSPGEVFGSVGESFLELCNLGPFISRGDEMVSCPDWESICEILSSGVGTLALTGHLGNWDLLAAIMRHRGVPLTVVGRPARNNTAQEVLSWLRERWNIKVIWRRGRRGDRELLRVLSRGEVLGLLIDQDTAVESTVSPFFGHPARTPSTLIQYALKKNLNIVSVFLVRKSHGKYQVSFRVAKRRASTEHVLEDYHDHLESLIVQHPEQWVWFHKRWRCSPEGRRLSSREYLDLLHSLGTRNNQKGPGCGEAQPI